MSDVKLIGIAGPSSSGKSTLAIKASAEYPQITVVKLDDFYLDQVRFPLRDGIPNWELPTNFRWGILKQCLWDLRDGKSASIPKYSKALGRQVGESLLTASPVVIVEGFLLYSQVEIRSLLDHAVYLGVDRGLQWERRHARDPETTIGYFDQVIRTSYARYAALSERYADTWINANGTPEEVWQRFRPILESYLPDAWFWLDEP